MVEQVPLAPAVCRAGRALLDWSQDDLAAAAKVSRGTVKNLERGRPVSLLAGDALRAALERGGVLMIGGGCACNGVPVHFGVALRTSGG